MKAFKSTKFKELMRNEEFCSQIRQAVEKATGAGSLDKNFKDPQITYHDKSSKQHKVTIKAL